MLYISITLTTLEIRLSRELARERHERDRLQGVPDRLAGDPAHVQRYELDGAAGELAFGKWAGLYPPLSTILVPGAPDYTVRGVRLDVKTNPRPNGDLLIPMHKKRAAAEIYVLVSGSVDSARFELVGWIRSEIAFMDRYVQDLGRGAVRVIPRGDLAPMNQLFAAIEKYSKQRTQVRTTEQAFTRSATLR